MNALVRHRTTCRLCDSQRLTQILHLPPTPLADNYVDAAHLGDVQPTFPLDVYFCDDCGHLQLLDVVDPNSIFRDYLYVTASSPGLVEHYAAYCDAVVDRLKPPANGLVVEIGSNDGSLLRFFQKKNLRTLGIDPAQEIARKATESGIETWPDFFNDAVAARVKKERGAAAIVTANNVFAHADDLTGVARGIRNLLAPDGVFVFEVAYLGDFVRKNLFDTVYHEHLSYHAMAPMQAFLRRNGLELVDAHSTETKGGSMRGFAMIAGPGRKPSLELENILAEEKRMGLDRVETYLSLAADLQALRKDFTGLIEDLKATGKKIVGYGASPSSTTSIYYFDLGSSTSFLIDENPLKHGRFSPGYHIPVRPTQAIYEERPDYVVILAWAYADAIMKKHEKFIAEGGHFIVPLPHLRLHPPE